MSLANAGRNNKHNNHNKGRKMPSFNDAGKVKNEPVKKSSSIDDIVSAVTDAPKGKPKRQISIYLDTDVAREFDRFGKKNGKGSKSELINKFLKKALSVDE